MYRYFRTRHKSHKKNTVMMAVFFYVTIYDINFIINIQLIRVHNSPK